MNNKTINDELSKLQAKELMDLVGESYCSDFSPESVYKYRTAIDFLKLRIKECEWQTYIVEMANFFDANKIIKMSCVTKDGYDDQGLLFEYLKLDKIEYKDDTGHVKSLSEMRYWQSGGMGEGLFAEAQGLLNSFNKDFAYSFSDDYWVDIDTNIDLNLKKIPLKYDDTFGRGRYDKWQAEREKSLIVGDIGDSSHLKNKTKLKT